MGLVRKWKLSVYLRSRFIFKSNTVQTPSAYETFIVQHGHHVLSKRFDWQRFTTVFTSQMALGKLQMAFCFSRHAEGHVAVTLHNSTFNALKKRSQHPMAFAEGLARGVVAAEQPEHWQGVEQQKMGERAAATDSCLRKSLSDTALDRPCPYLRQGSDLSEADTLQLDADDSLALSTGLARPSSSAQRAQSQTRSPECMRGTCLVMGKCICGRPMSPHRSRPSCANADDANLGLPLADQQAGSPPATGRRDRTKLQSKISPERAGAPGTFRRSGPFPDESTNSSRPLSDLGEDVSCSTTQPMGEKAADGGREELPLLRSLLTQSFLF